MPAKVKEEALPTTTEDTQQHINTKTNTNTHTDSIQRRKQIQPQLQLQLPPPPPLPTTIFESTFSIQHHPLSLSTVIEHPEPFSNLCSSSTTSITTENPITTDTILAPRPSTASSSQISVISTTSTYSTQSTQSTKSTSSTSTSKKSRSPNPMSLYPLRLYSERPPSPLSLTSSIAPPSLMPTTATGTPPLRSKRSANLKLSSLPSSNNSSVASTPSPYSHYPAAPSAYVSSSGHHQGRYSPSNYTSSSPAGSYNEKHSHTSSHHNPTQPRYAYATSLSTQQKLQLHQREIITNATRASGIPQHLLSSGPLSPRLIPLGSPGGVVTPLMLGDEGKEGGYFAIART
ncbi:hypothetical protein BZA77DRAFT_102648 [Pyronema omphalodes]|nr:hypothetical protein BZA77DRAFT_102648 [Pyronema omphalodes]